MKMINNPGNVIKDIGDNRLKKEYLEELGYTELKEVSAKKKESVKK